jgi:uncharacterized protein YqeY
LDEDLKAAMRSRETDRRDTIRYLLSEVHKAEIAEQREFHDEDILRVLSRQASQRRESIEAFTKGNRQDLVDKEEAELAVVLEYLPEQMSRDAITETAREVIHKVGASGPQDMGKVMGALMPQLKGRAQGKEVSSVVTELLRSAGG